MAIKTVPATTRNFLKRTEGKCRNIVHESMIQFPDLAALYTTYPIQKNPM